jgi:hypothetical protein
MCSPIRSWFLIYENIRRAAARRADQRHVHACRPDRRTAGAIRHSADLYDALYSSADTKVSKASGGIFPRVTKRRNTHRMFHVGDSLRGDYLNPRAVGWHACCGRSRARSLPNGKRITRPASGALAKTPPECRGGDRGMKTWTPKGDETAKADLAHHIGYDLLGPVVHRWLLALHQHLLFHDDGSTVALFCARAGVRISELYDICSGRSARGTGPAREMFWVSRLAVAKGCIRHPAWHRAQHRPADAGIPSPTLARSCLRPDAAMSRASVGRIDLQDRTLDAHGHNLSGWMTVNGPVQRRVREFLSASTAAFDVYLDALLDGRKRRF